MSGQAIVETEAKQKSYGRTVRKINSIAKRHASFPERYKMLEGLSERAIRTLADLIEPENPPAIRLAAAQDILNRVDGRPRQQATLEVKADMTTMHLDALRVLSGLGETVQAPEMIDVSPVDANG